MELCDEWKRGDVEEEEDKNMRKTRKKTERQTDSMTKTYLQQDIIPWVKKKQKNSNNATTLRNKGDTTQNTITFYSPVTNIHGIIGR